MLYQSQGAYSKAELFCLRALAIREKALGDEHPDTCASRNNLAVLYMSQGAYAKAEPLSERALAISEKALGADHPDTVTLMNNLAGLYLSQGVYAKAEPLFVRALAISEKALGPEHPTTGKSLNSLAEFYISQGAYSKAEPLLVRALAIHEKALGPEHLETGASLNNLAALYEHQGEYAKAEPLYVRALEIRKKALGAEHPATGTSLNNLALLNFRQGAYAKAEPLLVRALAISEKALGAEHPATGTYLNNLAELYQRQRAYAKAEPLYVRALKISEEALGAEHPATGTYLNNLAGLYNSQGAYAKAEALLLRGLAIREKAQGTEHPETGISLHNLAEIYKSQGAYAKAEPLYMRAINIAKRALGNSHPNTLLQRRNLALAAIDALRSGQGTVGTGDLLRGELDALTPDHLKALSLEVAAGSRDVRVAALDRFRGTLRVLSKVYLQLPGFRTLALNHFAQGTLNSRGRLLEETQAALETLRRRPGNRELSAMIDQLEKVEQEIVRAGRSKDLVNVDALYEKREGIVTAISSRSLEFRELTRIPDVPEITALFAGAAAVEFVALASADQGEEHYFAVVWTDKGPVALKDLGLAKPIREAAERYSLALSVPDNGPRLARVAAEVARLLLHPYWNEIPRQGHIYFSPEGPLASIAFDRLPDPDGKPIGDSRSVSLVGSLRDLAKWQQQFRSEIDPVGFFDPDFGASKDGRPAEFPRLRSTLLERDLMERVWPKQFQDFSGDKATKAALFGDKMKRPRILHIATQGFHRPGGDPMLGTGIALAGANESEEKGVVTATDMARLNLQGTQLVVLSACESGLGGSSFEDGLLGMQRSLTLAGARSQLLTLWKVPTEATVALMEEFYKRLKEPGRSKVEALRMAKSAMRDQGRAEWEWAGFVLYGDPGPLGQ